jgi:hypothetical protein
MEALLIHYLGNQRASLILIIQTALPCVSHTVSHASRLRLECVSNVYHNRNAANSQQDVLRSLRETRPPNKAMTLGSTTRTRRTQVKDAITECGRIVELQALCLKILHDQKNKKSLQHNQGGRSFYPYRPLVSFLSPQDAPRSRIWTSSGPLGCLTSLLQTAETAKGELVVAASQPVVTRICRVEAKTTGRRSNEAVSLGEGGSALSAVGICCPKLPDSRPDPLGPSKDPSSLSICLVVGEELLDNF